MSVGRAAEAERRLAKDEEEKAWRAAQGLDREAAPGGGGRLRMRNLFEKEADDLIAKWAAEDLAKREKALRDSEQIIGTVPSYEDCLGVRWKLGLEPGCSSAADPTAPCEDFSCEDYNASQLGWLPPLPY